MSLWVWVSARVPPVRSSLIASSRQQNSIQTLIRVPFLLPRLTHTTSHFFSQTNKKVNWQVWHGLRTAKGCLSPCPAPAAQWLLPLVLRAHRIHGPPLPRQRTIKRCSDLLFSSLDFFFFSTNFLLRKIKSKKKKKPGHFNLK